VSGGTDPQRAALGEWWQKEGLPPLAQLSETQARRVLDRIAELDWSTRPL
jgi:hypothetical protein